MFRKAQKSLSKARICLAGPAGSGKTFSALLLASGLGKKAAVIDTEHGSGDLYSEIFAYDIMQISSPFECQKYLDAIKEAENQGYDVVIIDSLTHAWSGEGGLLDFHFKVASGGKDNSYTAWRHVTPLHNALIEAILQSKCHVIATARSKMEYAIDKDSAGKSVIRKMGMQPVFRDGLEYEFTIFFDLSQEHTAMATKDRTMLFDGKYFKISRETGQQIQSWLNSNKIPPALGEKMGTRQRTPMQHDNASFLKSIDDLKDSVGAEIFHNICREYGPLDNLNDRTRQVELYRKLQETADFAVSIQ